MKPSKKYIVKLTNHDENNPVDTQTVDADGFVVSNAEVLELYIENSPEDVRNFRTHVAAFASGCWRAIYEVK